MYQWYLHCPRLLLDCGCNFISNGTSIHFAAETSRWHICCFVKGQTFSWKFTSATFVLDEVTRPPYGEMVSFFVHSNFQLKYSFERIILSQFISPMTGNTLFLRIPRILWVQTFKKAFWNQGIARNLILGRPDRKKNHWIALQATMTPRPETLFSVSMYLRSSYQQLSHLRLGPSQGFFTHDTAPFKGLRLALKIASKTTEIQGHHEVGEPR